MGKMIIPPDFREFLRLLNESGAEYMVIGGVALAYHGYVRATFDFDIWVGTDLKNASRVLRALDEFGFGSDITPEVLIQEDTLLRMGHPPTRLEVMSTIDGVEFSETYPNRVTAEHEGVSINFIGLDDLRENKLRSGRHKDLEDLEWLNKL